jgi:solute carrier family 35 protein F1/2
MVFCDFSTLQNGHVVKAVAMSQVVSILIACTSVFASVLSRSSIYSPAFLSCLTYAALFFIYNGRRSDCLRGVSEEEERRQPVSWWTYLLVALFDFEANYLVVLAFEKTSMTSVALLDQVSIPVACILTKVLGLAVYKRGHFVGIMCCMVGLSLLIISDALKKDGESQKDSIFGDALVLIGASMYGICNTMQELILVDVDWKDLLRNLGMYGMIISLVQGMILEIHVVVSSMWTWELFLCFIGFSSAMFAFYSAIPVVLNNGGSALLNLGLVSSDLYVMLARAVFFGVEIKDLIFFLISFVLVASGILTYSMSGDAKVLAQEQESSVQYTPVRTGIEFGASPRAQDHPMSP